MIRAHFWLLMNEKYTALLILKPLKYRYFIEKVTSCPSMCKVQVFPVTWQTSSFWLSTKFEALSIESITRKYLPIFNFSRLESSVVEFQTFIRENYQLSPKIRYQKHFMIPMKFNWNFQGPIKGSRP
jgi:hypothetical protein